MSAGVADRSEAPADAAGSWVAPTTSGRTSAAVLDRPPAGPAVRTAPARRATMTEIERSVAVTPAAVIGRAAEAEAGRHSDEGAEPGSVMACGPDDVLAPAGWLSDPTGRHEHRWWDGARWTDCVADAGQPGRDAG